MYRFKTNPLYKQATLQGIFGTSLFIALIFWPAGTFHYWQGWVFLATFAASTVGFTVYLAIYDKPLLEPVEGGAAARKGVVAEIHRVARIRGIFCADNLARV